MTLDDDELLEAVQRTLREVVLPALDDQHLIAEVRSALSIVGFVRRGLTERIVGTAEIDERLRSAGTDDERRALARQRLALEVQTRSTLRAEH